MKSPGMGYPINRTRWRAAEADPAAEKVSRTGLDRTSEIRGPISRRAFPSLGLAPIAPAVINNIKILEGNLTVRLLA